MESPAAIHAITESAYFFAADKTLFLACRMALFGQKKKKSCFALEVHDRLSSWQRRHIPADRRVLGVSKREALKPVRDATAYAGQEIRVLARRDVLEGHAPAKVLRLQTRMLKWGKSLWTLIKNVRMWKWRKMSHSYIGFTSRS
jgi:hypothetical protein